MIKTIRCCDICGREQHKNYDKFYDLSLPHTDGIRINLVKSDVCSECAMGLYWKINELKIQTGSVPIEI